MNADAFDIAARVAVVAKSQNSARTETTSGSLYRMMRKPGRALRRCVPASVWRPTT
jgi:hypothetical protein